MQSCNMCNDCFSMTHTIYIPWLFIKLSVHIPIIMVCLFTELEKQNAQLKAELQQQQELTPQLDEQIKFYHKQFTANRDNCTRYCAASLNSVLQFV